MKEEEALVRVVRVVRGSWNSKGVSVVIHNNFNSETRENRESVYGLFFLVRAVPVVRGLGFSNGVSAIIHNNFNRETRENREQKRECPL